MFLVWVLWIVASSATAEKVVERDSSKRKPLVFSAYNEVHGERITLWDLVENANQVEGFKKDLTAIDLGPAPKKSEKIELSSAMILTHLKRLGGRVMTKVLPQIPSKLLVVDKPEGIGFSQIKEHLSSTWSKQCSCELVIEDLQGPAPSLVKNVKEWFMPEKMDVARGSFSIPIRYVREDVSKTLWIKGRARWRKVVPLARRNLNLGQRLQIDDVTFESRDVTFLSDGIPGEEEIIGRRLRTGVPVGQIIGLSALERQMTLRRGEPVKISIGNEAWEVSMPGVAEQDGELGDMIKVRILKGQQAMTATVVGRGEVRTE